MAQFQFDASQVQPDTGVMDPVPAAWYNVMAEKSEIKPTKAADGSCFLEFMYTIVDGQYAGRKLFDRFNIRNSNPQAQEIGYKQLSALSHAVGVINWQDSAQLHNIPFKVKVKVRAADGQYEASNEITSRKHINENVGGPAAGAAPQQPMGMPPQQQFAPPPQQQAPAGWGAPQAPQQPAQQPWAQQPQQPPAPQQQWAPPPAAQQPWAQAPAQQPAMPPAAPQQPQQPAQPPAAQYPQQQAVPPWAQQR